MVYLPIEVGGIKSWLNVYIVRDLNQTMILGEDW